MSSCKETNSVSILSHIIHEDAYPIIDNAYVEIGKAFLEAIFVKVRVLKPREAYASNEASTQKLERCIVWLTSCSNQADLYEKCQKVWMFLGEMLVIRSFEHLQILEQEIQDILQEESRQRQQKSLDISLIQAKTYYPSASFNNSIIQILGIMERKQTLVPQFDTIVVSEAVLEVEAYLSSIDCPRSELSCLFQLMKIPLPMPIVKRENHYYHVSFKISFQCSYLNKNWMHFQAKIINLSYEEAFRSACRDILKQIYVSIPQLWRDFIKQKEKKRIEA